MARLKLVGVEANLRSLYSVYKRSARKRSHAFKVSLEMFTAMISDDCYLCGSPPSGVYIHNYKRPEYVNNPLVYNGLDRLDNSKGYVVSNLSTCCGNCNMAKKKLSISEFLEHIKKVYEFSIKPHESESK